MCHGHMADSKMQSTSSADAMGIWGIMLSKDDGFSEGQGNLQLKIKYRTMCRSQTRVVPVGVLEEGTPITGVT
jgi:hypothetical protein